MTAGQKYLDHYFGGETQRKIYDFLMENPGATVDELAEHCRVPGNAIRHHLERLKRDGDVTFDNVRKTVADRPANRDTMVDIGSEVFTLLSE